MMLFVQVVSSECILGVQIQNFSRFFNAEIRDDQYCCCDLKDTCNATITDWKSTYMDYCRYPCQAYFVINLVDHSYNTTTTNGTMYDFYDGRSRCFQFSTGESTQENHVRIRSNIYIQEIQIYIKNNYSTCICITVPNTNNIVKNLSALIIVNSFRMQKHN